MLADSHPTIKSQHGASSASALDEEEFLTSSSSVHNGIKRTYAEVTANILQSFDFSRSSHYACLRDSHTLSSFWFSFFLMIYSKQASELWEQRNSSIREKNQLRNVRAFLPSYKCFGCAPMPIIPSYVRLMGCFRNFSNKRTSFLPWKEYFLVNRSIKHYSQCSLHLWAGISILRHPQWSLDAHKG